MAFGFWYGHGPVLLGFWYGHGSCVWFIISNNNMVGFLSIHFIKSTFYANIKSFEADNKQNWLDEKLFKLNVANLLPLTEERNFGKYKRDLSLIRACTLK